MRSAQRLYESSGFYEIEPYRFNPVVGAKYLELDLRDSAGASAPSRVSSKGIELTAVR